MAAASDRPLHVGHSVQCPSRRVHLCGVSVVAGEGCDEDNRRDRGNDDRDVLRVLISRTS